MSEYFGPLMRSSRAREQRANERFLPLSRERSFRWFHEALVFETSLRPLPPLMFVGFSHRFLPFASNAGISKVLSGASFVVCSNFLSSARHYSASPSGSTFLILSPSQTAQVSISSCLRSCLLLRSGARLLANELLRRAVQVDGALPAGFAAPIVGPTTTQAFRQFMTCVSQLTRQAVFVTSGRRGAFSTTR
jgi:hypothetical protein